MHTDKTTLNMASTVYCRTNQKLFFSDFLYQTHAYHAESTTKHLFTTKWPQRDIHYLWATGQGTYPALCDINAHFIKSLVMTGLFDSSLPRQIAVMVNDYESHINTQALTDYWAWGSYIYLLGSYILFLKQLLFYKLIYVL